MPNGTPEARYLLHPNALCDLEDIWEYIAQDNLDAADRVVEDLLAACETLATSPHLGHSRPDLTSRPLRFWRVRSYLIAYALDEQPLWVLVQRPRPAQPAPDGRDSSRQRLESSRVAAANRQNGTFRVCGLEDA